MSEIRVNKVIDEAGTGAVELTQGATLPSGKTLSGAGSLNITGNSTFSGDVSIGGTLTYEDVTNIDSVGLITARSGINVTGGNTTIKGAVETVNAGSFAGGVLTLDTTTGTVFSHDLQSGAIGIVSITGFPVTANTFHTVTLLLNQNSAGTANTTAATGIGTNITLTPSGVSGFTTAALVGSGTTITLSSTAEDIDIVTFGIHYNGSGTGTPANYKTFATKNGDFRLG
nr:phage tail fiber-like protein [uncultured Mediterranean phage uvMED]